MGTGCSDASPSRGAGGPQAMPGAGTGVEQTPSELWKEPALKTLGLGFRPLDL